MSIPKAYRPNLPKIEYVETDKNNAYASSSDMLYTHIYDAEQAIDLFGEEHLEEYGVNLSPELIERYKKNRKEFSDIQRELFILLKGLD